MGLKPYNGPVMYRDIEVRRSKLKITNFAIFINQKQMSNVQIVYRRPGPESDVGASQWVFLYRCVCVVLLEGGEGLEEFGQVNFRVATGGQGFVWHFFQPPIRILFISHPGN